MDSTGGRGGVERRRCGCADRATSTWAVTAEEHGVSGSGPALRERLETVPVLLVAVQDEWWYVRYAAAWNPNASEAVL